MSAVLDVIGSIFEAIMAILEAIASAASALIEIAPTIAEALVTIAGAFVMVLEFGGHMLGALPKIFDGAMGAIPAQIVAYAGWTAVQVVSVALFPTYALAINGLFLIYTIVGLVQGADDVLGAPTFVAAGIAAVIFALNLYLATI